MTGGWTFVTSKPSDGLALTPSRPPHLSTTSQLSILGCSLSMFGSLLPTSPGQQSFLIIKSKTDVVKRNLLSGVFTSVGVHFIAKPKVRMTFDQWYRSNMTVRLNGL